MAGTRSRCVVSCGLLVALALIAWHTARPSAHVQVGTAVTWNRDVIGILERRCLACHRDGGPAPMSLMTYDKARPWARAIREEVLERRMPPSSLRSGAGLYENARALSLAETELLVSWADGGAPRGTGDEDRPTPVDHAHWTDSVPGTVLPEATSPLQRTIRVPVQKGWIEEWAFDPGTWPAASAVLRVKGSDEAGHWSPGDPPVRYPDGAGLHIPAADALTIDVTLARAMEDAASTGQMPTLHVRRSRATLHPVTRRMLDRSLAPAGPGERLLALQLTLAQPEADAEIVVAHESGEEDFLMAFGPPGAPDTITYRLREPLVLQPGDTLHVRSESAFTLGVESVAAATESAGREPEPRER